MRGVISPEAHAGSPATVVDEEGVELIFPVEVEVRVQREERAADRDDVIDPIAGGLSDG
jgi:hypothetical protein